METLEFLLMQLIIELNSFLLMGTLTYYVVPEPYGSYSNEAVVNALEVRPLFQMVEYHSRNKNEESHAKQHEKHRAYDLDVTLTFRLELEVWQSVLAAPELVHPGPDSCYGD